MLTITREAWAKFAPKCPPNYTAALFDNMDLLASAGILDNELRFCHWAGTVYHETGAFRAIREDLSYRTPRALRKAWPSRFGHKSDSELKPLLRNPHGLADVVYGCYSGRRVEVTGKVGPGEAWHWRGGGWFNTTFKASVDKYCAKLGIVPTPINALDDPVLTLKMAVLEWQESNCNKWADENSLRKVAKAINTGSAMSGIEPVGMDGRKEAFARAWAIWGDAGKAEVPAKSMTAKAAMLKIGTPVAVATETVRQVASSAPDVAPDPLASLEKAKRGLEVARDVQGIGSGFGEVAGWASVNLTAVLLTAAVIALVWLGPLAWRKMT